MILLFLFEGPLLLPLGTQLNEVARTVSSWADDNRMSRNTSKTKSLLITTLQKRTTLTSSALNVQIGVRYVEQEHRAKLVIARKTQHFLIALKYITNPDAMLCTCPINKIFFQTE